jgi:predicted unusual protein kinase regulating ubiquinone biosynthesis (AarF/ABC1/UbiB family)
MILLRQPGRVWQVLTVLALYFAAPRLGVGPHARTAGPVRLRLAFERLGGAWVKFGQMLAMRLDLLPPAYCDELFKLLNRVEPFPYQDVRRIIAEDLGDEPDRIFRDFERESFAAASIGQVHRATLPSGEQVAVKVQRPGVREAIGSDIELMFGVSGLLDRAHLFGATRSRDVIAEFARWTADELDYLVEARQAALLHDNAHDDRFERIARVHRELSTSRVLTTELISGIPLIDIIRAVREGQTDYLETLRAQGHDLDRIARHLDWNMLNQVYVFGTFHADLHPANLFVLPGDAIGYVDFGIVGHLSERLRESLTRYAWLLFRADIDDAVDELMRWIVPTAASDVVAARWRLVRAHQAFVYETRARARSDEADDPVGTRPADAENPYLMLAAGIMDSIRDHELSMSGSVVAYLRMLVTLGTLRHDLAVTYDVMATTRRFFRRLMRQQTAAWLDPRLSLERIHAGRARMQRAMEFLEFLEAQQQVITAGTSSLFGVRRRVREAWHRLIRLGVAALVTGVALYAVVADPSGTQRLLPPEVPYTWVHGGLLLLFVVLVAWIVLHIRSIGSGE